MTGSDPPRSNLRIWHIAESYPPDYGGGAGIGTRDICRLQAEMGHDVRVLCTEQCDGDPYTVRTDQDGPIDVHRVNLPYFRSTDPDGWQLGLRKWRRHERKIATLIDRELAEWRPEVVDYSTTRPLGEECLLAIRRHGLPIVGTLHEAWLICPRIMLLRSPIAQPCSGPGPLKCAECMYSEYDGSRLRAALKLSWRIPRLGVYPAYRIWRRAVARRQLAGALAVSGFITAAHRPHIRGPVMHVAFGVNQSGLPARGPERPRDPLRFGFMGGVQSHKGVWDVLEAAEGLKAQGLAFELHIWGPGGQEAQSEIARRDLEDRVLLRGMYDPEEVWSAYEAIDVAIIATTVSEPLGRVPLEAAAAGAPTIGANVGGIPESIQHEVNGLLYGFRDAADLKRQMQRLLEEPGLYDQLVDGLSPPVDTRTMARAVEAAYRRVLEAAATEPQG